jgi:hypothetical protein
MRDNPYDFTKPIRDPAMFYGRRPLLDEMVDNFTAPNPHSYSLFGGRRYGKTSLLREVERRLLARLAGGEQPCAVPLYIDLHYELIHSRGAFFACVVRGLRNTLHAHLPHVRLDEDLIDQLETRMADPANDPLPPFEQAFVHAQDAVLGPAGALQAVLLIDETERILEYPWTPDLQSNLRALLSNRPAVQESLGIEMAGSSDFYQKITEQGSPLRNILIKRFLPPLSVAEARALIEEPTAGVLSRTVVDEVLRQGDGHPFLIQYLMYCLWEEGLEQADVERVREVAAGFPQERDDFDDWCADIGPVGEQVYALLSERGEWIKRSELYTAITGRRTHLRKALEALDYHGLARADRQHGYRTGPEMFRTWFGEYRTPDLIPGPEWAPTRYDTAALDRAALRRAMVRHLTTGEFRTLCFDLGFEYEGLPGEGTEGKIRELILLLERRVRLAELVAACRRTKPEVFG